MLKHKIKISYSTGDSLGSKDTNHILEMEWENLDVAKANLKRIKEHYICYKVDCDYNGKKGFYFKQLSADDKLMYDTKNKRDWYRESHNNYHHSLVLKTDTGADWVVSTFWVGYFEHLYEVSIITDDSSMYFKF